MGHNASASEWARALEKHACVRAYIRNGKALMSAHQQSWWFTVRNWRFM